MGSTSPHPVRSRVQGPGHRLPRLWKVERPGASRPVECPLHLDVLAAVRHLKQHGATTVSVIGGSMGGAAAGDASILSRPGAIERVVMLGSSPNLPAEELQARTLFVSGEGPRLPRIRAQYDKAPEPKELIIVDGSAHAQYLFETSQGERVMREILRFLLAP